MIDAINRHVEEEMLICNVFMVFCKCVNDSLMYLFCLSKPKQIYIHSWIDVIIFTTKCSIYVAFTFYVALFFTHTTEHNRKTFSNTINKTSFNYVFFFLILINIIILCRSRSPFCRTCAHLYF